ncbi:SOS response-associated peptidase [Pelagibius sp.]|uniref:SOS response-associated peptidase n=1 Tax=Pelagibius sp. TaxID=1931238 RepID=UPI0026207E06|nr:SOS response-associated peptidase [Pelagibius sp.]
MCGRFLLTAPVEALQRLFGFPELPNLSARFNVAPGQAVAAMRLDSERRRHFVWLRWGLVPSWAQGNGAKGSGEGVVQSGRGITPLINARAETVAEKPSFRAAFRQRRCVVFADGFYEWRQDGNRQPYCVRLAETAPFAFAAVWEPLAPGTHQGAYQGAGDAATGEVAGTCALITTQANDKMAVVHHRMPVILPPEAVGPWLDPASGQGDLFPLLRPLPAAAVALTPVSKRVNAVREDDAGLLEESVLPEAPAQLKLI